MEGERNPRKQVQKEQKDDQELREIDPYKEKQKNCHTERQISYDVAYMWNLKKKGGTNEFIYKTEVESWMQETNLWLPGDKGGGGINWEIVTDIYTLLHIKQITNKNLQYSTGNSTQYSVITCMGIESKKE